MLIIGTLRFTERQRDGNVLRQTVNSKEVKIIVVNNAFEYLKSGSRIVDDGKSNIFPYCINAGVLNLAGGVSNSI